MRLEDLYSDVVMFHYKNSPHRGRLNNPTHEQEGANLSCGDLIHLYLIINDKGIIEELKYDGHGCAVSMASASMLADLVEGTSKEEAKKIIQEFYNMIKGEKYNAELLGDAAVFSSLRQFPVRVKCATLAWHTLEELIK
ncbi:Fe-S cluster assembly sulfur transfer protein SufU [Kosmotoga pacifica]|uniref:Nitrogen fixation protein NifU n=1 Tax=Kosmotoga pacifica TaxID=1330330 RepID=A0A0G2ZE60_9BACT|nr:SUF system NifU family Fe-S cluster assembly protein [Kosmotoga pacifica]AKI97098.1 nitrogen fixation protein NifU [Kosmotoga pacifica]